MLGSGVLLPARAAFAQTIPLPSPLRTWFYPGHTRYYVDSIGGNDANNGKSPATAWQSLTKVNTGIFTVGDWILLKCGSHWNDYFSPAGSGEARHPIKVTSYGDGPKPQIDAQGKALASVFIQNGEYWDIENLDVTNTSTTHPPLLCGVEFSLLDFGTAHGVTLRHLDVHDVASAEDKGNGGSGIFVDNRGDRVLSRYDGLLIEDCHLWHNDRNGLTMDCGYWHRPKWYPNLHVIIRGNLVEHTGGDCIVAIGCDGALLEHNIVHGGRERCPEYAAGIWVWSCDNSVLQFNESSGMIGQEDAQGFDADYNNRNTLIQYNYSHDNQGGFVMMCSPGEATPDMFGNVGTTIRYNISQNDGFRIFTLSGPIHNAQIYNNTIYTKKGDDPDLFFAWNWGGAWPDKDTFSNNIFQSDGTDKYNMGGSTHITYTNNDFFGTFNAPSTDPHAVVKNPMLKAPGSAADGIKTVGGYKLNKNSPCYGAGAIIPSNGGRDYFGKKVPSNKATTIGAGQD
jgi:hypothetical protein